MLPLPSLIVISLLTLPVFTEASQLASLFLKSARIAASSANGVALILYFVSATFPAASLTEALRVYFCELIAPSTSGSNSGAVIVITGPVVSTRNLYAAVPVPPASSVADILMIIVSSFSGIASALLTQIQFSSSEAFGQTVPSS